MMNITLIRKDTKNRESLATLSLDTLIQRIQTGSQQTVVERLRDKIPMMQGFGELFADMHRLQKVYPAVSLSMDKATGDIVFRQWNGLVLLTIGGVGGQKECRKVVEQAATLPMTVAAFVGSSGRTVKVLVHIEPKDGEEPRSEASAQRLYDAGFALAQCIYGAVLAGTIRPVTTSLRTAFRMTFDADAYYNSKASPLMVEPELVPRQQSVSTGNGHPRAVSAQRQTDYDKYDDYEFQYSRAVQEVRRQIGTQYDNDEHYSELFATEVARRLRAMGFPEEETNLHMRAHLMTRVESDHLRAIVSAVYAEEEPAPIAPDAATRIRLQQQDMMRHLEKRYVFRYNTVMGYTEYRPNNTWVNNYQPVDERAANQIAIECRMAGLDVWDKDLNRYLRSAYVPAYNPIWEYLDGCWGQWDGTDHIRQLARTVPTDNTHWPDWFYTWFLGMVAQWRAGLYTRYGNQAVPLLISRQGYNKSTFCQSLLPPELRWGYNGNMLFTDKKQVLQQMSQMLLINLDEFNQISPQLQEGFLKNIITLPTVKVKRPYGKHVEEMPRLASFIATTNQTDVLSDPSGARRFLGIELTGPIDVSRRPNYRQLYAQALEALKRDVPSWFDSEQTQQIIDSNRRFQRQTPAEHYFLEWFEPAQSTADGQYLTAAAIFNHIRKASGADLRLSGLSHFGRAIAAIDSLQRKRTNKGTEYLVKFRK